MRILKDNEWKFEGKENGFFRFRRLGLPGEELVLIQVVKYVITKLNIVLFFDASVSKDGSTPEIQLSYSSRRRMAEKLLSQKEIELVNDLLKAE